MIKHPARPNESRYGNFTREKRHLFYPLVLEHVKDLVFQVVRCRVGRAFAACSCLAHAEDLGLVRSGEAVVAVQPLLGCIRCGWPGEGGSGVPGGLLRHLVGHRGCWREVGGEGGRSDKAEEEEQEQLGHGAEA